MGLSERLPVRRVPVLQPYDLKQFREIARGAMPVSAEEIAHGIFEHETRIFGVPVYDESMAGAGIEEGAIVLVNPDLPYEVDSTVAVIAPERGRILIRKYRGIHTDAEDCRHINLAGFRHKLPSIETYPYGDNAAQVIGCLRWITRSI